MQPSRMEKRKKTVKKKFAFTVTLLVIIIILGFSTITYANHILNKEVFYPNIKIAGIDMENLTKDMAITKLKEKFQPYLDDIKITLAFEDKKWEFDYKDIGAQFDIEEKVEEAYRIGRKGSSLNRLREIYDVYKNGFSSDVTFSYDVSLLKDKVQQIADELYIQPEDASVKFHPNKSQKFSFTSEKVGREMDVEATMAMIEDVMEKEDYSSVIDLPVHDIQPEVFVEDLKKATYKISSFSTDLSASSAARTHNIRLASETFNGRVVKPGEVFSFNESTGVRSKKKGYKDAAIIVGGKVEDGTAGGVCQVSSTLYNAVLMADLEIVERTKHAFPITYVGPGRDATVVYGALDFKFRNNKDTLIFIASYVSNKRLLIEIYGEKLPNNRKIEIQTEIYSSSPAPEPKRVVKKDLPPGTEKVEILSRKGLKVRAYKVIYENGVRVKRVLISDDYYKPIKGLIYYNPAPKKEEKPKDNNNNQNSKPQNTKPEDTKPQGTKPQDPQDSKPQNPQPQEPKPKKPDTSAEQ